jgi:tRNA(fMet)-specific endonuclease VapC
MKILVDTDCYRDFCIGVAEVVDIFQRAERIYLSFVSLAELRSGFLCGQISRQNEPVLTRFLNQSRVSVCYPDADTTHHYARVLAQLRQQNTPIPTNSIWIAALVLQHDLLLLSRDKVFDHLPQLAKLKLSAASI